MAGFSTARKQLSWLQPCLGSESFADVLLVVVWLMLDEVVAEVVVVVGVDVWGRSPLTKQEQADDMLDEELEQFEAISEGVGPKAEIIVYELQKAELNNGL